MKLQTCCKKFEILVALFVIAALDVGKQPHEYRFGASLIDGEDLVHESSYFLKLLTHLQIGKTATEVAIN